MTLLETNYLRVVSAPIKESAAVDKQRVALNNLRGTIECISTLKTSLGTDMTKHFEQVRQHVKALIKICIIEIYKN